MRLALRVAMEEGGDVHQRSEKLAETFPEEGMHQYLHGMDRGDVQGKEDQWGNAICGNHWEREVDKSEWAARE